MFEDAADYLIYNDAFIHEDADCWRQGVELEQRNRELLAKYQDKAMGKKSILESLTEEIGREPGEFDGASIDEAREGVDPFPCTVVTLEEKK